MVTGTSETPARRTWERPLSLLLTTLLILVVATVGSDAADSEIREKTSVNPQEAETPAPRASRDSFGRTPQPGAAPSPKKGIPSRYPRARR